MADSLAIQYVLDPNTYHTLTESTFMASINLGLLPIIAGNVCTASIPAQENAHKEHLREYKEYKAISKAIL